MSELKPCLDPTCCSHRDYEGPGVREFPMGEKTRYQVECIQCSMRGPRSFFSGDDAALLWNLLPRPAQEAE